MLSPEGLKLLFCPTETRSQTFQLEARGTKSIVYGQYGRRANKAHSEAPRSTMGKKLCKKIWLWSPYVRPPLHVRQCDQYHVTISRDQFWSSSSSAVFLS